MEHWADVHATIVKPRFLFSLSREASPTGSDMISMRPENDVHIDRCACDEMTILCAYMCAVLCPYTTCYYRKVM